MIDYDQIAGFIFQLLFVTDGRWYLAVDKTNWQWGKSDINILTLAIIFKGAAIPIYWELLDKKGNSDTPERIALIEKFVARFGKNCIASILDDREFIGGDWFRWLLSEKISFDGYIKRGAQREFLSCTALGGFFRRQKSKLDSPKAITAIAYKIARLLYAMLRYGQEYVDVGMDYYETQYQGRVLNNLTKKAKILGFQLVPLEVTEKVP